MKPKDLRALGIPKGAATKAAIGAVRQLARRGETGQPVRERIVAVIEDPERFLGDPTWAALARALGQPGAAGTRPRRERAEPAPWRQWGRDLEPQAVQQMANACRLPVAVRGALMPDAHLGYGLPIGGVLATDDAVIPYAVGVDIACRMKMTVLDLPVSVLDADDAPLQKAIEEETRFGIGAAFRSTRREHEVMDRDWSVTPITARLKDKAWSQLGTSGSGNHFVELGELLVGEHSGLDLEPGRYLALLSHSGSRGAGAAVAGHYSKLAMARRPELPRELRHLAWLELDGEPGHEYWQAMELMGHYAAANHACIHRHVARHLGAAVLLDVENHHNFAWKEVHDGREVVVHRKGATPAGEGVLGIIPGSMADPAYLVRGKGSSAALDSASHGAGRVMSRKRAHRELSWEDARRLLAKRRVRLLSAGLDEVPMVYKDIDAVMAQQRDLVTSLARFHPRLVKMAPGGERPED